MPPKQRKKRSKPNTEIAPLPTKKLHILFTIVHTYYEKHHRLPVFNSKFAETIQAAFGDTMPLPASYLRTQAMNRGYGNPPRAVTLDNLHNFYSPLNFSLKTRFAAEVLRPGNDWGLHQMCTLHGVDPAFWFL